MVPQFFGQKIEVEVTGEVKVPVSFRLGEQDYQISEIIDKWDDYGFGKVSPRRKRWWHRHHRTYYVVKTALGEVFEIYHDRGTSLEQARKADWYLHRQL